MYFKFQVCEFMSLDYYEYLSTPEWQQVRKLALQRAGYKCQICGIKNDLDVHHNIYENLGNEQEHLEDVVVLCSKHHQLYHDSLAEIERLTDQRLEERLLGALLQQPPALVQSFSSLHADVFTSNLRQEVFKCLRTRSNDGQATDSAIMASYLDNKNLLDAEEAEKLLNSWVNRCTNPHNAETYARELSNLYIRRKIQKLPAKITKINRNSQQPITALVDQIQAEVQLIVNDNNSNRMTSVTEILLTSPNSIKLSLLQSVRPGFATKFHDLDAMTGGLQPPDLIIIAGRPAMGKTAISLNIAYNIVEHYKLPVCIFSLEMSKEQVIHRLLSFNSGIESGQLRSGNISEEEWKILDEVINLISGLPLYIDDCPNISVSEIRSKARQVMLEHKSELGLIVIDYLQLITGDNDDNRALELTKITRQLKGLAKELNVPVVALSQLNRSVESRTNKRPMLSDLRESGSIEQEADIVMMIYRDSYYNPDSPDRDITEIIIAKHRNGPTGVLKLFFDQEVTEFKNLARNHNF